MNAILLLEEILHMTSHLACYKEQKLNSKNNCSYFK